MNKTETFHDRLLQVETLVGQIEGSIAPDVCDLVRQLTRTLLELHKAGLESVWQQIENAGPAGATLRESLLGDPLVASLLVLHNLHPIDLTVRLHDGIARAREFVQAQGGRLQVTSVAETGVRLRLTPSCTACHCASVEILQERIEELILAAAPDVVEIAVEVENTVGNLPFQEGLQLLPIVEIP